MAKSDNTVFYRDKSGNLRVFNTSKYMNDLIRSGTNFKINKQIKKELNDVNTSDELLEFIDNYFNEYKFTPNIIVKNKPYMYVNNINKIDDNNIKFAVINDRDGSSRIAKSNIKNFKKNYEIMK